jgi:hypothetical protein
MLVLTRHRNEQIVLEEQIVVTVLDIDRRNGIVRLGITAGSPRADTGWPGGRSPRRPAPGLRQPGGDITAVIGPSWRHRRLWQGGAGRIGAATVNAVPRGGSVSDRSSPFSNIPGPGRKKDPPAATFAEPPRAGPATTN